MPSEARQIFFEIYEKEHTSYINNHSQNIFPVSKKSSLYYSRILCFPCLEKVIAEFPVSWPPCFFININTVCQWFLFLLFSQQFIWQWIQLRLKMLLHCHKGDGNDFFLFSRKRCFNRNIFLSSIPHRSCLDNHSILLHEQNTIIHGAFSFL